MYDIPVFAAERDAGLAERIRTSAAVAYAMQAQLADPIPRVRIPPRALARVRRRVKAADGQPDLHYLRTVLVTTGWNLNDDVFERLETWAARHSPEDKPFNYEHQGDDIIGHITANQPVDLEFKPLDDATVIDELPPKFHILTGAVLYKCWEDESLQERMDTIIGEIAGGGWFVSMEALFKGFDYALMRLATKGSAAPAVSVVGRSDKTAFLTKHLRAYGGDGTYQGYRVGRLLRGITFSGKGLVRRPANPDSVIFTDTQEFNARAGQIYGSVSELEYSTRTRRRKQESKTMADTELTAKLEAQKARNKALADQVESLTAALAAMDKEKVKAREDALVADLKSRDERVATLTSEAAAAAARAKAEEDEARTWKAKFEEADKEAKVAREELQKAQTEARKAARVAALMQALEADETKAGEMVEQLAGLSDEAFKAHADYLAEKLKGLKDAGKGKDKDGSAVTPKVKQVPKQTDKPAPMAGHPKKVKTVGSADLDDAEPDGEADLNGSGADEGAEKVRASITDFMTGYFGLDEDGDGGKN